jgi:type II secretory ATPase GspE/PulE/Tfp pilus assembly ATPase PilB-like protein
LLRQYGDRRNIVTIEDPVEYNVPGVNQTQVNEQAGVTFARTLRSLLRQDPDIVLVGEIRDSDTAAVAIQAALTGHLILATLHTNDALGAVERLQDLGGSAFLIASTVRIFQAQRLLRTLCPHCGTRSLLDGDDLTRKVQAGRLAGFLGLISAETSKIYEPVGCPRCEYTGYLGRAAIMEMAPVTHDLVTAIERQATAVQLAEAARAGGYRPMIENAISLLCQGKTALEEVESLGMNLIHTDKEW